MDFWLKNQIKKKNEDVIKRFALLERNPQTDLKYVGARGGDQSDWHFSTEFYTRIKKDLTYLNDTFVKKVVVNSSLKKLITPAAIAAAPAIAAQAIMCVRHLITLMDNFKFNDIISLSKNGQVYSFQHNSDRYTSVIQPAWLNQGAPAPGVQLASANFNGLQELLTAMVNSGASIGASKMMGAFNPPDPLPSVAAAAAAAPVPGINFVTRAGQANHAWQGVRAAPPPHVFAGGMFKGVSKQRDHKVKITPSASDQAKHQHRSKFDVKKIAGNLLGLDTPPKVKSSSSKLQLKKMIGVNDPAPPPAPAAAAAVPDMTVHITALLQGPKPAVMTWAKTGPASESAPQMQQLFEGTQLNEEPFPVTKINKLTGNYITIDVNARLRNIVMFRLGLLSEGADTRTKE